MKQPRPGAYRAGCFVLKRAAEREIALAMRGRKIYNGKRISCIEKDGG